MSALSTKDAGILFALADEFKTHRLPRLQMLKEVVDNGNALSDVDITFLNKVLQDAQRTMSSVAGHPELHEFCSNVVHLYKEITEKALENEKKRP